MGRGASRRAGGGGRGGPGGGGGGGGPGGGEGLGEGDAEALQAAARDLSRQSVGGFVGGAGAGFALAMLGQGVRGLRDWRRVGAAGRAQGALVAVLAGAYYGFLRLDGALEPNLERLIARDSPLGAEAALVLADLAPGHPLLRSAPQVEALDGRRGLSERLVPPPPREGGKATPESQSGEPDFRQRLRAAMSEVPGPSRPGLEAPAAGGAVGTPSSSPPQPPRGNIADAQSRPKVRRTPEALAGVGDLDSGDVLGFLGGARAGPASAGETTRDASSPRSLPSDDRARRSQRLEEILERRRQRSAGGAGAG